MAENGTIEVEVVSNRLALVEKWFLAGVILLMVIKSKNLLKWR